MTQGPTTQDPATPGTPAAAPVTEREKNAAIIGVLLAMLLAALDQSIVAPAMPTIGAALGHVEYLSWVVTAYLLTATAAAPLYGKLSDVHGRRVVLIAAILIFLAGAAIAGAAQSMPVMIAGRAVQGLGGGGLFALSQTIIADLVPPIERARYAAWVSGTWGIASLAGPLLGGLFAQHLHWSLIFWINLPLGALALAIVNGPLRKLAPVQHPHRLDILGAVLLMAATSLLLLALNWGGSRYPWTSTPVLSLFGGSALLWVAFAARMLTAAEPLVSVSLMRNRIVLWGSLAMCAAQAGNVGLAVYLPVYMQSQLGLSVSASGTALLGLLLGTVAGAALSGRMIPRVPHYRHIALAGAGVAALLLLALSRLADSVGLALLEPLTILAGIGLGATFPVGAMAVQNAVESRHLGVATGVLTFLRSLGGALGVAILGAIAIAKGLPLAGEGAHGGAAAHTDGFGALFAAAALMIAAAIVAFWLMPDKPLRSREVPTPMAE